MNAEEKNRYFHELTLNLQHEGFAVKPETLSSAQDCSVSTAVW